jgi:hypothetical protein
MSDVSLGGSKKTEAAPETKKMIYLNIPTAIMMIIELADSQNIKKYSVPMIKSIKESVSNKELRKILCGIMGVKSARKLRDLKPAEFNVLTQLFGDVWGLNDEENGASE